MTDPAPASVPPQPARRLSEDLHDLAATFAVHAVTVDEVMTRLGARASALLMVICGLPFCSPVTIPGLSTPFGLVILILALRFVLGLPPWLPARLRRVSLPPRFFARLLEAGSRIVGWIERQLRPRWGWLSDARWKLRLHAVVIAAAAALLLLPLPPVPPLTNTLPALVIVILSMSSLERDGFGLAAGHLLFVLTLAYFAFWATVITGAIAHLWQQVAG